MEILPVKEAVVIKIARIFTYVLMFGFLLGIHHGYVALWHDGDTNPVEVFPYRAEMLPKADRQALKKGIVIENEEELTRLLEDYLS